MAESLQETFRRKVVPVGFERTMGLLGATTLGIGALMGAGIYVLIGLAAGYAGPAVWLSYLACGLLSLLSVLVFGELSRNVPVAGGGYAFVYSALGSFWGFMSGWLLAFGTIFACAMYAKGFVYYFSSLLPFKLSEIILKEIAVAIIAVLTWLNCHGTKGGDRIQRFFTLGNLLILLALILFSVPNADPMLLKPLFPRGIEGVLLPASIALRKLYKTSESVKPPHLWKRYVPEAAFLANLILLLTLDWVSTVFGLQLVAVGFCIYFSYSRKREIRSRTGMSIVLTEKRTALHLNASRILVPMANPHTQPSLFSISEALLGPQGGEVVVLHVVEANEQMDFYTTLAHTEDSLQYSRQQHQIAQDGARKNQTGHPGIPQFAKRHRARGRGGRLPPDRHGVCGRRNPGLVSVHRGGYQSDAN